jgi:predicted component of viral defense system (DUF524 family)
MLASNVTSSQRHDECQVKCTKPLAYKYSSNFKKNYKTLVETQCLRITDAKTKAQNLSTQSIKGVLSRPLLDMLDKS